MQPYRYFFGVDRWYCNENCLSIVDSCGGFVSNVYNPTIEVIKRAIISSPSSFQYMANPTPDIIRFALEHDGQNIVFLPKPVDIEYQRIAVKRSVRAIRWIKDPCEEIQLLAVNSSLCNGEPVLQFIRNPTYSAKLIAVSINGENLRFIHDKTEELQLAAVANNGNVLQYIHNASHAVQLAAVQHDGCAIRWIANPSYDIQLAAVKKSGYAIEFIVEPTPELQRISIANDSWVGYPMIAFADESLELQNISAALNGQTLAYINKKHPTTQKIAVRNFKNIAVSYIHDDDLVVHAYYILSMLFGLFRRFAAFDSLPDELIVAIVNYYSYSAKILTRFGKPWPVIAHR